MPKNIKYSIVIPTLNGYKTLSKTLPTMLQCSRKDVQWIVSDNCSDDELDACLSQDGLLSDHLQEMEIRPVHVRKK